MSNELRSLEKFDADVEAAVDRRNYLYAIELLMAAGLVAVATAYACEHGEKLTERARVRVIEMFAGSDKPETARGLCRKWRMSNILKERHHALYREVYPKRHPAPNKL